MAGSVLLEKVSISCLDLPFVAPGALGGRGPGAGPAGHHRYHPRHRESVGGWLGAGVLHFEYNYAAV